MNIELKPCPFCGANPEARRGQMNPKARCRTEGCKGSQLPVTRLDDPEDIAAWNTRAAQATQAEAQQPATGIEIDFKQTTELLTMFGGEPATVTLIPGDGHRGKGLYAYYTDLPEEGAEFLGEADDEAVPDQQPATPEPVWCVATGERVNGEETYTHHDAYVPLADCFPLYTHPAPSVPDEKPLPDLMMASYHEAIGWNACRAAMLATKERS